MEKDIIVFVQQNSKNLQLISKRSCCPKVLQSDGCMGAKLKRVQRVDFSVIVSMALLKNEFSMTLILKKRNESP